MKEIFKKLWDNFNDDKKYIGLKIALMIAVFVIASMLVNNL